NLFQKNDSSQLMGKGHRRQAEHEVGALANGLVESYVPSQHERDAVGLVDRQSLEPLRKLQRIQRSPSLIENDRKPGPGHRLHQPLGLGAHDRRILRALSTALERHLPDLDRVEMLDSIEITVDD